MLIYKYGMSSVSRLHTLTLEFQAPKSQLTNNIMYKLHLLVLLLAAASVKVEGHGYMLKPASRSSVWRVPEYSNQNPPVNYADNQLYCGGVHQENNPGTNCGVCGDPLGDRAPRPNEHGGTYGKGIITGRYLAGQTIDVEVQLTVAHLGYMEWRLCPNRNTENQNCFNQHLLRLQSGGTRLNVDRGSGLYHTRLQLPSGVRCNPCVIQWNYRAGNNWGQCQDGSYATGCGPQETFRGCSDVVIN